MDYKIQKLTNGLFIWGFRNEALHSVTMAFIFPVSPGELQKQEAGLYHYLEHLFFRRLGDLSQEELYCTLERMGTTLRGTAYPEYIRFAVTTLPKYCDRVFDILIKLFETSRWTSADLREEKTVVVNQILYQDYYDFRKIADREYYKGTGYEYPIMGSKGNARFWTKMKVEACREQVIDVGRAAFVVAGAYDEHWLSIACRKMEVISSHSRGACFEKRMPQRFGCRRVETDSFFLRTDYDVADILLSFDVPSDMDLCAAEYVSSILGEGDGAILSLRLREQLGLTDEVYSFVSRLRDSCRLVIQCSTANSLVEVCLKEIFSCLSAFCEEIPETSFSMAKPFLTENRVKLYDDSFAMMEFLENRFLYPGLFKTVEECINCYEQIDLNQLAVAARCLFTGNNLFLGVAHNGEVQESRVREIRKKWEKCRNT